MTSPSTDRLFGSNSSLAIKAPCRVATTAAITLSGEQTIDGVAVVTGDRVLVKNQTSGVDNGIYISDTSTWQRSPDFDGSRDVATGTLVKVNSGTVGQGFYYVTTTGTIIVGTTSLTLELATNVFATFTAYIQTLFNDPDAATARATLDVPAASEIVGLLKDLPNACNGYLSFTVAGNALTIALKNSDGDDPSSAAPVYAVFRPRTATGASADVATITAALSLTIPNGATMGFTSGVEGRLWAGLGSITVNPFPAQAFIWARNCWDGNSVSLGIAGDGSTETTAVGTGSDSAHVSYSTAGGDPAATIILAHADWSTALVTAGAWAVAPDAVTPFGPGVPLPGEIVQIVREVSAAVATGTTPVPNDDTRPLNSEGDEYQDIAITLTSLCNVVRVRHVGNYASSNTDTGITAFLHTSGADAVAVARGSRPGTAGVPCQVVLDYQRFSGIAAGDPVIGFNVRAGTASAGTTTFNGSAGARLYGGFMLSHLTAEEIQA